MRQDVASVVAVLRSKRALFADSNDEIWEWVFASLNKIRETLSELSGKLHAKGPNEIKHAVDLMLDLLGSYLATYEADYTRFMQSSLYRELAPAHKERNWPELGEAADDLIELRSVLFRAARHVATFADNGSVEEWKEPNVDVLRGWSRYAQGRRFCPTCGLNMYYADDDECPRCPSPSGKTTFRLRSYARSANVAGSFNRWAQAPMRYTRAGGMIFRVDLPPGEYLYKYVVDGVWLTDPENPVTRTDPQGNVNSLLIVPDAV